MAEDHPINLEAILAKLARDRAESEKFAAEQRKLTAEADKFAIEQIKLAREAGMMLLEGEKFRAELTQIDRDRAEAHKLLRESLSYEPRSGMLRWKRRPRSHFSCTQAYAAWNTKYADKAAGTRRPDGYIVIIFGKRHFLAHRTAWLLMTGTNPPAIIDHRDGDPSNNRWANLRPATNADNLRNGVGRRNETGMRGVRIERRSRRNPFRAEIRIDGRRLSLGGFPTAGLAYQAYCEAARKHHGEFWSDGKR